MTTDAPTGDTLVIMAKAPRPGYVKTRLDQVLPRDAVVALYRCLIEDTIALAQAAGAPRIAVVCPRGDADALVRWLGIEVVAQEGDGLAAGLDSVFRLFFGRGCRRVIAFNGDTPHLAAATLAGAFTLLETHDLVVGPTTDGGYYLIGATRPHRGLFEGSGMGTGSALRSLLARAHGLGLRVALTEEYYDVDDGEDLARLAADLRAAPARAPRTAAWLAARQQREK
ncbi:MAG TPA: TIGR04282 family arsenosugar biosynthesis glycosyltransferase [Candidatus Margulisiibacteriota bacterium]|nr:TIGR04282 family arsenosugar biosynthesis glycosyltransferase [Candidatus Margulisiibacteriota bacterium]